MRTAKGREFVPHQAANTWISADFTDGTTGIVSLRGVQCTEAEWHALLRIPGGFFPDAWHWRDGRILRRKP